MGKSGGANGSHTNSFIALLKREAVSLTTVYLHIKTFLSLN